MNNWQEIDLSPMLKRGFPDKRLDRLSANNLTDCRNHRVTEFGLQPVDPILLLSDDGDLPAEAFPFPSICVLEKEMSSGAELFTLFQDEVFKMEWNGTDWNAIDMPVVQFEDGTTPFASTVEDVWHTAEFNNSLIATNGIELILTIAGVLTYHTKKVPNTVCKFRGRVYAGGLAGNNTNADSEFWNDDYIDVLETLVDPVLGPYTVEKHGQNVVYYSNVDPTDFFQHYTDTPTLASLQLNQKLNNSGFIAMPWSGKVLCVKPLGEGVVVYGENGVSFLRQNRTPAGMQHTGIQHEGIPSRKAVGGDRFRHVFIGNNGSLWELSADLKLRELGYQDTLSDIGGLGNMIINYDPSYNDVYIGAGADSRLITQNGMSKMGKSWISLIRVKGSLQGFYKDISGAVPDDLAIIETGVIRFPGGKAGTTHGLRLSTKNPSAHLVTLYHRSSEAQSWKEVNNMVPDAGGYVDWVLTNYEQKIRIVTDISAENNSIEGAILYFDQSQKLSLKELTA